MGAVLIVVIVLLFYLAAWAEARRERRHGGALRRIEIRRWLQRLPLPVALVVGVLLGATAGALAYGEWAPNSPGGWAVAMLIGAVLFGIWALRIHALGRPDDR